MTSNGNRRVLAPSDGSELEAQSTCIDRFFQGFGSFFCGSRSDIRCFEPPVFFDLVVADCVFCFFGAHHDYSLELAVDFLGFAPDEELANIKFNHYYLPMDDELLLYGTQAYRLSFFDVGEYGSC